MEKLMKFGSVLGRSEMKKIMAGSGGDDCRVGTGEACAQCERKNSFGQWVCTGCCGDECCMT